MSRISQNFGSDINNSKKKTKMRSIQELIKGDNAILYVWAAVLAGIFTLMVVYAVTYPLVTDVFYNYAIEAAPGAGDVLDHIILAYKIFPIIMIIGLFLWGLVNAQKREYDTGLPPYP